MVNRDGELINGVLAECQELELDSGIIAFPGVGEKSLLLSQVHSSSVLS